jgi:hypothetical protein
MSYVETTFVRLWPSISDETISQIFVKFSMGAEQKWVLGKFDQW